MNEKNIHYTLLQSTVICDIQLYHMLGTQHQSLHLKGKVSTNTQILRTFPEKGSHKNKEKQFVSVELSIVRCQIAMKPSQYFQNYLALFDLNGTLSPLYSNLNISVLLKNIYLELFVGTQACYNFAASFPLAFKFVILNLTFKLGVFSPLAFWGITIQYKNK